MIDFSQQKKIAKKANKNAVNTILRKLKQKRITQQERIEKGRYENLKKLAKIQKITISKLLDEVIDQYLLDNNIRINEKTNSKKLQF